MKDERLYAKFTLDFPDHPKIALLSTGAKWALVDLTIWCCRMQTDGVIPKALALAKHSLEHLLELCLNDDDFPSLLETEKAYVIHDFAAHQLTKAEIEMRKAHAKEAGHRGGVASTSKRSSTSSSKRSSKRSSTSSSKIQPDRDREVLDPNGSSTAEAQRAPRGAPRIRYDRHGEPIIGDDEPPDIRTPEEQTAARTAAQNGMAAVRAALTKKPQPL